MGPTTDLTRPIETPEEYEEAVSELKRLWDTNPSAGSEEGVRMVLLVTRLEAYEKVHFPIPEPTPEDARQFREQEEPKK